MPGLHVHVPVGIIGSCLTLEETGRLFQRSCTILHSHHQFVRDPLVPILTNKAWLVFNFNHSGGCVSGVLLWSKNFDSN